MLNQMKRLRNIEIQLSYRGSPYFGWQIQPSVATVQGILQRTLRRILQDPELKTIGASRTDTGVHAHDQRVGFSTPNTIPLQGLQRTLNHRLPRDIRALQVWERPPGFSVRYGATAKHYSYFWDNRKMASPFFADLMSPMAKPLDENKMNDLCTHLLGTQCFKAFQASRDSRANSQTTLYDARVGRLGDLVFFDVQGHHFLYHMVRNIATSLARVGLGEWTPAAWIERFQSGDRRRMCKTAPAQGLHLFKVYYAEMPQPFSEQSQQFQQLLAASLAADAGLPQSRA